MFASVLPLVVTLVIVSSLFDTSIILLSMCMSIGLGHNTLLSIHYYQCTQATPMTTPWVRVVTTSIICVLRACSVPLTVLMCSIVLVYCVGSVCCTVCCACSVDGVE